MAGGRISERYLDRYCVLPGTALANWFHADAIFILSIDTECQSVSQAFFTSQGQR